MWVSIPQCPKTHKAIILWGIMETKITFNTGYTLEFRPVSRVKIAKINLAVIKEFQERDELLDPPTYYTVEPTKSNPEGIKESHNETTLMTDEDKKAWALYENTRIRLKEEQAIRSCKYVLFKGIVTDIEPTEEWLEQERKLGIELSKDKDDLKLEYLYDEILISPKNVGLATSRPLVLGDEGAITDVEVEAVEDTFQGNVEPGADTEEPSSSDETVGQDTKE